LDKDKRKEHLKSADPTEGADKRRGDFQAVNKFKERKNNKEQKGGEASADF
jgi:hypothetical protein